MREPTEEAWLADYRAQGQYTPKVTPEQSDIGRVAQLCIATVWVVGTLLGGCVIGGLGALVLWMMR